ncbi:MAG: Lrp/AsnC family transcriptional regulator [Desulfovibrionaceae bacterium]
MFSNGTTPIALDDVDRRILALLQANARTPNAQIAREIGMAPSAVLERIRKLERNGVIQGYEVKLNPKALGQGLTAFIFVRTEEAVGSFAAGADIARLPEVMEVHHTAGHDCYLVKARVSDTEGLGALLQKIGRVDTSRDTRTTIVLKTLKETLGLPIAVSSQERKK